MRSVIIIPARYDSTRFPGKPLVKILGIPMIIRVANICSKVMGKDSVALRLDYVDGDVTNNTLENLRLLCPNCYLSHNGHMPSSERFYK